jgi:GT2 family glycosyltransferase
VPTFGRVQYTKRFLSSLSNAIGEAYLVLLIDDHPEKLTFNSICESVSVKIYNPGVNIWWVGSINYGIEKLLKEFKVEASDVIIFANNDVQIDKASFGNIYNEIRSDADQILHPITVNQNNVEVSSGAKIKSFFPYITDHPINFKEHKRVVDMGAARFLVMSASTLKKVGYINNNLVQYLGDNYFTLKAKTDFNIKTYILSNSVCRLDDEETGLKNNNIKNFEELLSSFFSIKSPNNIKYRYIFFKNHFNGFFSFFITLSMTLNSVLKFIIGSFK